MVLKLGICKGSKTNNPGGSGNCFPIGSREEEKADDHSFLFDFAFPCCLKRATLKMLELGCGSSLFLQFPWAKWEWPFPKILHISGSVGGKAAVNDTFIQRLFVKFFTDVLIESTGQEVVAVFAYECLHVGNIFIKVLPSGVVTAWESQLPYILHFKGKIQLCVSVSRIKLENLN